jgi:cell division protein ZapA
MLLMAGLMLADKTAGSRTAARGEDEMDRLRAEIAQLRARPRAPDRVEVPVIPAGVAETLAELAARAEALADRSRKRARPDACGSPDPEQTGRPPPPAS